jgi:hypothetical protein
MTSALVDVHRNLNFNIRSTISYYQVLEETESKKVLIQIAYHTNASHFFLIVFPPRLVEYNMWILCPSGCIKDLRIPCLHTLQWGPRTGGAYLYLSYFQKILLDHICFLHANVYEASAKGCTTHTPTSGGWNYSYSWVFSYGYRLLNFINIITPLKLSCEIFKFIHRL